MILTLIIIIIILILYVIYLSQKYFYLIKENEFLRNLKPRDLWLIKERIKYMNAREFEIFCECLFAFIGYQTYLTKASADAGKDIILTDRNTGEMTFVECKHWNEYKPNEKDINDLKISRPIAQKLKGSMEYGIDGKYSVRKGIIITTAEFTNECIEYCKPMGIELYGLDTIMELVEEIGSDKLYIACGINREGYIY